MANLTDEYGIEKDSRYATCVREAIVSGILFLGSAAATVGFVYFLTVGQEPAEYANVLGLPSYIFWGIVATPIGFLFSVWVCLRTIFQDTSLDPVDPECQVQRDEAQAAAE